MARFWLGAGPNPLAMLFCVFVAPHVARLKGIFLINQLC